jgi:hypothetical protein
MVLTNLQENLVNTVKKELPVIAELVGKEVYFTQTSSQFNPETCSTAFTYSNISSLSSIQVFAQ